MSIRINYKMYPTDYIQELKRTRGVRGRKKARAFMEYVDDMEHGDHNSEGFYAKSWEVSRSTSHEWIKDFALEFDRFTNYLCLKSQQHYSYAAKQTEQTEQMQPSKQTSTKPHKIGAYKTTTEQTEQVKPREALNLNNTTARERDTSIVDGAFTALYATCRIVNKNIGSKSEAYRAWERIKNISDLRHQDVAATYMLYYLDQATHNGKPYGLANFLNNDIHQSYSIPYIKLTNSDNEQFCGYYNRDKSVLETEDGDMKISVSAFNTMLQNGGVEIMHKIKAKV